ncbi:MAG TPA: DNA repair protein RecO [Candidatus Saccharimonadales bacterium]
MNRFRTRGIVLRRVNFGEADRIVTFITSDYGLVSAMAKGVRKPSSKLAGGLELFSVSDVSFIKGKGELDHLISSRMIKHFGQIVTDYDRVQLAYAVLKHTAKAAKEFTEPKLYELIASALSELNQPGSDLELIDGWFKLNLLKTLGQQPNLTHDISNQRLTEGTNYTLLPDDGAFKPELSGQITTEQIKAWRVLLTTPPSKAVKIGGLTAAIGQTKTTLDHLFEYQFS